MQRLLTMAAHSPRAVFIVLAVITLVALYQIPMLRLEINAEGLMVNLPDTLADYQHSLQTFGSDAITVIYLEDENLMEPAKLRAIRRALSRIDSIPQVSHTSSLFSMRYLRSENGYIYTNPYLEPIPENNTDIQKHSSAALLNPLIERNLLSRDGKVMAINVYLDMTKYQRGFDELVAASIDQAIAPLQGVVQNGFQLGNASIRARIGEQIRSDLKRILPFSIVVLSLTTWLVFKCSCKAFIPLLTAGLSVVWTFGLMAVLDIPVNVLTSIIPALLIVIGSTEDIHLIAEYQTAVQRGLTSLNATRLMAKYMGTAILLTFLTTSIGFISIGLNHIDILHQFGVTMAIGLLLNFVITSTLVPSILGCLRNTSQSRRVIDRGGFSKFTVRLTTWFAGYPVRLGICLAFIVVVCLVGSSRITVNNSVFSYFPASSILQQQANSISTRLSGIQTLTLLVSGSRDAFLRGENIRQLKILQNHLKQIGGVDKSFSFADFIAVVHNGIGGEASAGMDIPENDELISGYMSLLGQASARSFVSEDFSEARIIVRHSMDSSRQLNQAVDDVIRFSRSSLPEDLMLRVTGSSYLNSQAVDYMAVGQIWSISVMLVVIFSLISLLLSDVRLGLIAVISNLFPIVMLFGVMGYLGITLDTSTVMVAAIALGICVDHTMHFMVRYKNALRQGQSWWEARVSTLSLESLPVFTTTLALALGFSVLGLSDSPPVVQFGLLSAMVMLLALIGIFVITPLILQLMNGTKCFQIIAHTGENTDELQCSQEGL